MSTLKIQEQLELDAPMDRVWAYLVDPQRVVTCLPGASIDAVEGERTYRGSIKVKVGPANMTYSGVAEFVELDAEAHRMRLEGKGKEKAGGGQVQMTMESTVEALEGGRTRVVVDVDVKLAGKIVKFGRGMIGVVSERLFDDFAECLGEKLAAASQAGPESAADVSGSGAASVGSSGQGDPPRELSAIRLVLRALWSRLKRLFGGRG